MHRTVSTRNWINFCTNSSSVQTEYCNTQFGVTTILLIHQTDACPQKKTNCGCAITECNVIIPYMTNHLKDTDHQVLLANIKPSDDPYWYYPSNLLRQLQWHWNWSWWTTMECGWLYNSHVVHVLIAFSCEPWEPVGRLKVYRWSLPRNNQGSFHHMLSAFFFCSIMTRIWRQNDVNKRIMIQIVHHLQA